jgi:hypothetical protein
MQTKERSNTTLILLVLALAGLAQWFFGNLYEAVVTVPNWRIPFEYEVLTGQSQNAERTIWYYVPLTHLALLCLWVAVFRSWRTAGVARRWLGLAAICGLGALLLTVYIVTQLNLQLFFGNGQPDLVRIEVLIGQWQRLNYGRLALVGTTLLSAANSLRLLYRAQIVGSVPQLIPQ